MCYKNAGWNCRYYYYYYDTSLLGAREQNKDQWVEIREAAKGMQFSGCLWVYLKNFFYYEKFQTHTKVERIVK